MPLVLDNNIFFSLMNPKSINSYLFSSLKAEFITPEYVKLELNKYKSECLIKSGLSEHEFEIRRTEVEKNIEFLKLAEYKTFLKKAKNFLPDPKDSPYLALALRLNCSLWSNDMHFKKQTLVPVLTTEELVNKLLSSKL